MPIDKEDTPRLSEPLQGAPAKTPRPKPTGPRRKKTASRKSKKKAAKKANDRAIREAKARGEPPLPPVRKPPPGSGPEALRVEDYDDAWRMYHAGLSEKTIAESLGLSRAQVKHLYQQGLVIEGVQLPSFRRRFAEQEAATAEQASSTGQMIAGKATTVLAKHMANADTAATLIALICQHRLQVRAMEMAKPPDARNESRMDFSKEEIATLRTMRLMQDFSRSALAYNLVFGHNPAANRALVAAETLVNGQRKGSGGSADHDGPIPAALALMSETMGDSVAIRLKDDILGAMASWTPEQLEHFAKTGEEPGTKSADEVIDVEYEEQRENEGKKTQ